MISSLDIPAQGFAGLCVGDDSGVALLSSVAYTKDTEGRLIFNYHMWREFHKEEDDLQVGQAVLITARNTRRNGLNIMFVIDLV